MAEISNSMLAAVVLATLVFAVSGTYIAYVNSPGSLSLPFTGHATEGSGNVSLTINLTLAIEVDTGFAAINFGTCAPRAGTSYWCSTNDSIICTGANNDQGNCTGDNGSAQFLQVNNVGNVDAAITLASTCNATTLIGGTAPDFSYITTHCNGTAVDGWTSVTGVAGQAACTNVSFEGGQMRFYANVTIPQNAVGFTAPCAANQTVVTFSATTAT